MKAKIITVTVLFAVAAAIFLCLPSPENGAAHTVDANSAAPVTNLHYEMFYGEWEMTGRVFVDRVSTRGSYKDDTELEAAAEFYAKNCKETKIEFSRDTIAVNGDTLIENFKYTKRMFPSNDDYLIHFTMTLKDIGLTESAGAYYAIVYVDTDARFESSVFFIKDENTLIVYKGDHCVEYTRTSFKGGSDDPVIIVG